MKFTKNLFFIALLVLFSLFASQKLFTNMFYTSHDGEGHVIRMEEFDSSFTDGQIPVRLAKRINHGLSYPFFNFNYPFIYYFAESLHKLGLSFVVVFKAIMVVTVILGSVSLYLFCLLYFTSFASFVAATFYIFAPYRFLNMYVRADIAESLGLALLPLVFFATEGFLQKKKNSSLLFIFSFSLLILSHNITAMIGTVVIICYFLFRLFSFQKKKQTVFHFLFLLICTLCITVFFWLPVLIEAKLTKLIELTYDYQFFFPTLKELIYSPWGFGQYVQGMSPGKMSPQIGIIHTGVFLIACFMLCFFWYKKRKVNKTERFIIFFIFLGCISFFLCLPVSKSIWDTIYFLKVVQIPWRFVGYITLSCAIAAGFLIDKIKSTKIAVSIACILFFVLLYSVRNEIRVNMYVPFNDPFKTFQVYGPSTTSKDEHMPLLAPRIYVDPNPNGDLIASTSGVSKRIVWKSNYHKFDVTMVQSGNFRDNTSYFPGWEAMIDGKTVPMLYASDPYYRLRVKMNPGKHIIIFSFHETWYRILADWISIFSCITFVLLCIYTLGREAYEKNH